MSVKIKPLNNEELLKVAPSIFSENPIEGVSSRYAYAQGLRLDKFYAPYKLETLKNPRLFDK